MPHHSSVLDRHKGVGRIVSVSNFRSLLLLNQWRDFDENWYECSSITQNCIVLISFKYLPYFLNYIKNRQQRSFSRHESGLKRGYQTCTAVVAAAVASSYVARRNPSMFDF